MQDPFRNDKSLPRAEFGGAPLQVNEKTTFDHVEELILSVMLVPVILALHHAQTHDGFVYSAGSPTFSAAKRSFRTYFNVPVSSGGRLRKILTQCRNHAALCQIREDGL